MSTIIRKQVEAFSDAVMDAHREALIYWTVQDIVLAGPNLVQLASGIVRERRAAGTLTNEMREAYIEDCKYMLAVLSEGLLMIDETQGQGYDVKGADDYDDAILEVRELLVSLLEEPAPSPEPDPAAGQKFLELSRVLPPKQSWFEEDPSDLRLPRRT